MPVSLGVFESVETDDPVPVAITADGGCRLKNPSPYGGMWAFRITNAAGQPVYQASGVVLPHEIAPLPTVTNNLTETLALLIGLEFFPAGWSGKVRTDSLNAIRVFREPNRPRDHLTPEILERCRAVVKRLGRLTFELLAGHPTGAQLAFLRAGKSVKNRRGHPFCLDNHWCDKACSQAWSDYEKELARIGT